MLKLNYTERKEITIHKKKIEKYTFYLERTLFLIVCQIVSQSKLIAWQSSKENDNFDESPLVDTVKSREYLGCEFGLSRNTKTSKLDEN